MPKIEKDLLKVKGSDGQWHYVPAVGGEGGSTPAWDAVQNKPFESLGDGLEVDENGVLSAKGGTGGSPNAVQYVAQELTDEQKAQARENIGAKATMEKSAYIISKTRSYGYIYTTGMDFDGVYALIQSGKVVMLLVDNSATYYGVITPANVTVKTIMFYNIRDMSRSDVGGRNKGITYFGFTWHKGDDNLTEWWGDIPSVEVDETLTKSGSAADAKAVGDALQNYVPAEKFKNILNGIGEAFNTKLDKNQGTENAGKILGIGEDGIVIPQDKPTYTAEEVGALPNTTVIPPAYTLPQATADALGGIKADAATAEDTQPVRMGADGKLRTKPTGGSTVTVDNKLSSTSANPVQNKVVTAALAGKITAPTTAAVGQIIKVKSVDDAGKPTEWECADLPSGGGGGAYKLLYSTTLEQAAVVSVDMTEEAAACDEYILSAAIPKGDTNILYNRFTKFAGNYGFATNLPAISNTFGTLQLINVTKGDDQKNLVEFCSVNTTSTTPTLDTTGRTNWNINRITVGAVAYADVLFDSAIELPAGTIIRIAGK